MNPFILGFVLSFGIGFMAYLKKSLTEDGFVAALIVGTLIYGYAGLFAYLVLMVFFLSSIIIGLIDKTHKKEKRNAIQVFANASVAAIMAYFYGTTGIEAFLALFIASIGVSTSDTWASEIGRNSESRPFHIFTFKPLDKGLSGAVSLRGILASLAAALLFGFISSFVLSSFTLMVFVALFSFIGSIIDSMLGTLQVKYLDPLKKRITEEKSHLNEYYSGLKFLDNNGVNFLSNVFSLILMGFII